MKNNKRPNPKIITALIWGLALSTLSSCQKDGTAPITDTPKQIQSSIMINEAENWLKQNQNNPILKKQQLDINDAKNIQTPNGNRIIFYLTGSPQVNGQPLGYRELSLQKDEKTKKLTAEFIEIIPDYLYWQEKQTIDTKDFSGKILKYNLDYQLKSGAIYQNGKRIGETRMATNAEKLAFQNPNNPSNNNNTEILSPLSPLNFEQQPQSANAKLAMARVIETCYWYQTTYIDAEGVFNVHSERICDLYVYDDGSSTGNGIDPGYYPPYDPNGGGGGGSGSDNSSPGNPSSPPPPSELPMENQPSVDPKKMADCFANITDPNASYQVKVLVLEPFPGTSFNYGPNSFGHVALQLTKSGNGQIITQTMGFYPTGTGLDKLVSKSRMIDNGELAYTMSATYWPSGEQFKKLLNYVANPPTNYHYIDFNCASFVYQAGQKSGINIPDPTTQIGISGPGGAGYAMTPQGMAAGLDRQKAANPNQDISRASGRAPSSKGECK